MAAADKRTVDASDYSMAEKISALYDLQKIDSNIDEINKLKGELPFEVQDLEDDITGLETRIENINSQIDELNQLTKQRKDDIEQSKALIKRYTEQQNNVRNNREFESLSKEIEYQTLEIELSEKRLKEYSAELKTQKRLQEEAVNLLEERKLDLQEKKSELDSIDKETAADIQALAKQREVATVKIDERLIEAYNRIRGNARNGLAVVTIQRDACGGCYNRIPPQRQVDIKQNKKIIVCEYCGRILVSNELDELEY